MRWRYECPAKRYVFKMLYLWGYGRGSSVKIRGLMRTQHFEILTSMKHGYASESLINSYVMGCDVVSNKSSVAATKEHKVYIQLALNLRSCRKHCPNYRDLAVCRRGSRLVQGQWPPNLALPPMWHETLFDELKASAYRCKNRSVTFKIHQNAYLAGESSQWSPKPQIGWKGDTPFSTPTHSMPRFSPFGASIWGSGNI